MLIRQLCQLPLLSCVMFLSLGACGSQSPDTNANPWPRLDARHPDTETEAFISELLGRMTTEEKVGQIIQAELRSVTVEDIRRYHLGSVLNGGGAAPNNDKRASVGDWLERADAFYDASMDTSDGGQPIPVLWGSDAVHGHSNVYGATIFPHNIGLGAARNPELLREIGAVTAMEMLVTGIDWTFAPTLAVVRDDRWGRSYEGYSEDPRIVALYAKAIIHGLQGIPGSPEHLGQNRILATAKHFIGDGGTAGGRDQGDNPDSEEELVRLHNAGYAPAIEAGVRTVMASFSSWRGQKVHAHHYLLTTALKGYMGFDGFVVGDWNAHGQIEGCSNDSCATVVNAGIDMFMVPEDFRALFENTLAQVRNGTISHARLDDAVRRILRVKKEAGLFEAGRPSSRPYAGRQEYLGSPEHRALARSAVRQSLVLLKNADGLLPLSPSGHVLVAGDGADNIGKQAGGWTLTWQGTGNTNADFPGATSIHDGIRDAVEAAGGTVELAINGRYRHRPDVAIVAFGEDPYAEFQGDRAHLLYEGDDGADLALLRRLRAEGIPVVAVFLSGRPLWVNTHLNAADAFIAAWLPGSEGGGIADLLFTRDDGKTAYDFTGRLSFSWPRTAAQATLNIGDAEYDPLFAYGYGLTLGDDGNLPELPEDPGLPDVGAATEGVYFDDGQALSGYSLRVGADRNDLLTVTGLEQVSVQLSPSVLMADYDVQGDASLLLWRPDMPGYFAIAADEQPLDLQPALDSHLSLTLLLKVDEPPLGLVWAGMRDAGGQMAQIDITPLLDTANEWHQYGIALQCFAKSGIDMRSIAVPLELYTTDAARLVLAEVRLAAAEEGNASCPGEPDT